MGKNTPAIFYGLTALVWDVNAIVNEKPFYFVLSALFLALSILYWKTAIKK